MHAITDWLDGLSGPVVYVVIGALVFTEDALFFSFFIPGETAAVLGGFLADRGRASIGWMVLVVVCAAVLGDSAGYEIGRHLGPAILRTRPLRRHDEQVDKARDLIRRRGPAAVFFGRFVAFFRPLMPSLAGISRMPYRRFLLYNALGGLAWGVGFTLLGYFAGAAYTRVEGTVGRVTAIVIAALVVIALLVWYVRRHRSHARGASDGDRRGGARRRGPARRRGTGLRVTVAGPRCPRRHRSADAGPENPVRTGLSGHPSDVPAADASEREEAAMTTRDDDNGTQPDEAAQERSAEERSITAPTPADVRRKAEGGAGARERSAEERSITAPTPADVRRKGETDDEGPQPPGADAVAP
ncbi:VTT domain-containing protein [Kitasatospora sp. NPDC001539]|uniref:DedA family protein n=1 Tax=unclassified Kitasatospora TaxID=2633591 RepID=UPI003323A770